MAIHWGQKVRQLREQRGWTQDDLAKESGLTRENIAHFESGHTGSPTPPTLKGLSKAFKMPQGVLAQFLYGGERETSKIPTPELMAELQERTELSNESDTIDVPIIGYIAAGIPVPTEQQDLGKIPVSKLDLSGVSKMSGVFGLIVSGDSLIGDEIQDRYTVIVDPNPDIIDGKIYVVKLGTEYVARHLHRENGSVVLTSSNGKYEKMQVKEVEIKGRVVLSGNWKKH
jgi:SOS-response transcriptional repressor LexA